MKLWDHGDPAAIAAFDQERARIIDALRDSPNVYACWAGATGFETSLLADTEADAAKILLVIAAHAWESFMKVSGRTDEQTRALVREARRILREEGRDW